MSMVQGRRILYNYPAYQVHDFWCGSSGLVKKLLKLWSFNSLLPSWAAAWPSCLGTEIEKQSTLKARQKCTPWSSENTLGEDRRCLFKLDLTLASAYRYYSTTLNSGNGMRRERKKSDGTSDAAKVCEKPLNEKQSPDWMKEEVTSISPTASPNALDLTANSGGPGVFDSLRNLEKVNGKFRNIMKIISDVDTLILAYEQIKSKPGNLTRAISQETLDKIDRTWFEKTSLALKTGNYVFSDSRRKEIPKPKGGTRPLTISNPRDKIIQKACEIVLNYIYEEKLKRFTDKSHGFRPNKGCHTALEQIKFKWKAQSWYLEFDLKKAFDTINRKKLINILEEDIADRALTSMLDKMFNSKVLIGKELLSLSEGVPQGNILSPLLSNIFFSKLDEKVEQLITKYRKGEEPTVNNQYLRETRLTVEERAGKNQIQINNLRKRKILIARKNGILPTIQDDNYRRITYVRYADDFIVGVRASKETATRIFNEVKTFLKSELHLTVNEEKSHITHVFSDVAFFLGMRISCIPTKNVAFRRTAHVERFRRLRLRVQRKFDLAHEKQLKTLQKEVIFGLRASIDQHNIPRKTEELKDLMELMGLNEAIKRTNDRGILRTLASELGQLKNPHIDKSLLDILNKIDQWIKTNPENIIDPKEQKVKLLPITMKEIGIRIHKKFGDKLNLKTPPTIGFRVKTEDKGQLKKISKLPESFSLTEAQLTSIMKEHPKSSYRRYLEVIRIISDQQDNWTENTLIESPVAIGVRKSLEGVGLGYSIPPQINADLNKIRERLKTGGVLNAAGQHGVKTPLLNAEDADIIRYYNSLAYGLLSYYRCADNLADIKALVAHSVKFSLMDTLRSKHRLNKSEFTSKYGNNITCLDYQGKPISFIPNMSIFNLRKEFLINVRPNPFQNLDKVKYKVSNSIINQGKCAVKGCTNEDIEIHHIRQLFKRTKEGDGFSVITAGKTKRISGRLAIESGLKRKQLPLCREHHRAWHRKEINTKDLQGQFSRN